MSDYSNTQVCLNKLILTINKPLIPTEGAPAATAARAYSICTSFPEGLKNKHII